MSKRSINFREVITGTTMLLLLTVVLSYSLINTRTESSDWKGKRIFMLSVKSCEEAEKKAVSDFNKGLVRMYFSSGVTEEHHKGFPYNFYNQLENKFGIDIIYTGDVMSSFYNCYNLKMDDLLGEKLGEHTIENLFNKLRDENSEKRTSTPLPTP